VTELAIHEWGEGVPAVLVHGSISAGEECWPAQRALAGEGFRLVVPDRRGYGGSPGADGEDFARDAEDVAELLGDGAHLVGHSYGGVASLLAAAARPDAVLSLAVIEPPAFGVRPGDPTLEAVIAECKGIWARPDQSDREFLEAFLRMNNVPVEKIPEGQLAAWAGQVGPLRGCRQPWEAEIPFDTLRAAPFPKLVVSGGHSAAFDVVCDELTAGIGAERVVIPGAGHSAQRTGEPFNQALLKLWRP
jgi:pimeloyl-ACP methyl ester carboxylesterase